MISDDSGPALFVAPAPDGPWQPCADTTADVIAPDPDDRACVYVVSSSTVMRIRVA